MESAIHLQLKSAREKAGLSLEDASHQTRIPVARIVALEGGDFAGFGSMAYAKSFLRSYSQFLGLEAEDAIQNLPKPILGGAQDYQYLTTTHGPWLRGGSRAMLTPQQLQAEKLAGKSLTMRTVGMVVFIACGIVAWAIYVGGTASAQNAKKEREEAKAAAAAAHLKTVGKPENFASHLPIEVQRAAIP